MSPFASVADTLDGVLAGVVLLNVLVLAPLALVSVYWVAARIGGDSSERRRSPSGCSGRGCCSSLGWSRYDPVIRDRVLPLVLGLTAEPAFPAAVALVSSAALISTSLDRRSLGGAALAGLIAGAAVAVEPHSLLFLGGAAGAYVASRRIPEAGAFALALVPARARDRALDRSRRRRARPALSSARWTGVGSPRTWQGCASTSGASVCCSGFQSRGRSPLRAARRPWHCCWVAGRSPSAWSRAHSLAPDWPAERSSACLLPALPAYVLLAAAIPLLVPTLSVRLGSRLDPLSPGARPGRRALAIAAIVLAAVPLATAALGSA